MSKKTYAELLKDPRWQRKRLEIMERDDFKCRHCGSRTNTLTVHHAVYRKGKNPWEYPNETLFTYCEHCHGFAHSSKDAIEWQIGHFTAYELNLLYRVLVVADHPDDRSVIQSAAIAFALIVGLYGHESEMMDCVTQIWEKSQEEVVEQADGL